MIVHLHYIWARQDSNLRPTGYEPAALTAELRALHSHSIKGWWTVVGKGWFLIKSNLPLLSAFFKYRLPEVHLPSDNDGSVYLNDLCQETCTDLGLIQPKILCNSGGHIRKRLANTQVYARLDLRAKYQQGHVFP